MVILVNKNAQNNEAEEANLSTLALHQEDGEDPAVSILAPFDEMEVTIQAPVAPDVSFPEVTLPVSTPSVRERLLAGISRGFWGVWAIFATPPMTQRERDQREIAEVRRILQGYSITKTYS